MVKKSSKDITFEIGHSNYTSAEKTIFEQALLTYLQESSFIISVDAQFNFSVISDKIKKEIEDLLAERKKNALLENLGIPGKFKCLEAKIDKLTAEVRENNKLQKDNQERLKNLLQLLQSPENNLLQKMERVENSGNLGFWPTLNK